MPLSEFRRRHPVQSEGPEDDRWEWIDSGGPGPVLVMLPGAQGTAESFFRQFALSGSARLIAAAYPADPDSDAVAERLAGFLGRQTAGPVVLLGTSLGGYIAQLFANRHATRLSGLILTCTFADPAPVQSADRLAAIERSAPDELKAQALARLDALPESEFKRIQQEIIGRQDARAIHARMLAVQRARAVPAVTLPADRVLVIDCDDDPLIPPAVRAGVRARHPGALTATFATGGHYPYLTRAEDFNRAVSDLLSSKGSA